MSETTIDTTDIEAAINESGALDDPSVRTPMPVDLEPSAPEPDYSNVTADDIDAMTPEESKAHYEYLRKEREASPNVQARQAAREAHERDAAVGRQFREKVAQVEQVVARDKAVEEFSNVLSNDEAETYIVDTGEWDEDDDPIFAPTPQLINTVGRFLDAGVDPDELADIVGEDLLEQIEDARAQSQQFENTIQATAAFRGAGTEFHRLKPLGQNAQLADRAAELMADLAMPAQDPETGEWLDPPMDLAGMSEEQGAALALATYRIAAVEQEEMDKAFSTLKAVVQDHKGDVTSASIREFLDVDLPDLLDSDLAKQRSKGRAIVAAITPQEVDPRPLFAPLSIPFEEAMMMGGEAAEAHRKDAGERAAAMSSQIFGTEVPYDDQGMSDEWKAAIAAEQRRLKAEHSTPKADELGIEETMSRARKAGDRAADRQALKQIKARRGR